MSFFHQVLLGFIAAMTIFISIDISSLEKDVRRLHDRLDALQLVLANPS